MDDRKQNKERKGGGRGGVYGPGAKMGLKVAGPHCTPLKRRRSSLLNPENNAKLHTRTPQGLLLHLLGTKRPLLSSKKGN